MSHSSQVTQLWTSSNQGPGEPVLVSSWAGGPVHKQCPHTAAASADWPGCAGQERAASGGRSGALLAALLPLFPVVGYK